MSAIGLTIPVPRLSRFWLVPGSAPARPLGDLIQINL